MVAILGANSVSGGYEISNSLRFNDDDSPFLSRTNSSGGDRQKFTISFWTKRGTFTDGSGSKIFDAGTSTSTDSGRFFLAFFGSHKFAVVGGATTYRTTTQVFRDTAAWYHIVVAVDSTQATADNRVKIYVNGNQVTTFDTNNAMTLNQNTPVNESSKSHQIGRNQPNTSEHYDGYITEFHHIDGQQKLQTDFGEFNDNGVWIPKKFTGSYGNNGFYLEFKQTGTSQNSSGIGADTSGNDNHFAPTNLAAQDVTTDTCTNNFATLNFLDGSYDSKLSEGNLVLDTSAGGSDIFGRGTIGFSQGKWYWEVKSIINGGHGNKKIVGVVDTETPVAHPRTVTDSNKPYTGVIVDLFDGDVFRNTSGVSDAGTFATNDIVGILFDADNGLLRLQQNGSNLFSGNAVTTNAIDTTIFYLPYIAQDGGGTNNGQLFVNFGNPTFSISSGNSDANGHGNFEYAVPSGYFSICSKNLAEFG